MLFMNEYDIEESPRRFGRGDTPNLLAGAEALDRLCRWTNANSDGWAHWPLPSNAAKKLMTLLQAADRFDPQDCTEKELRAAFTPIKAFLTKRGVDHAVVFPPPNPAPDPKLAKLRNRIAEQRQWIKDHGGSRAGYIERYGSKHDPEHYGDGGEAIYAADQGELDRLLAELELATVHVPSGAVYNDLIGEAKGAVVTKLAQQLRFGALPKIEAYSEPGEFTRKVTIDRWILTCGTVDVRFLNFDMAATVLQSALRR